MLQGVRSVVYLAMFLATCLPAVYSAQSRSVQSEYRKFTDSRGRAIQARVLRVDGGKVTIQRRDGKQFTVPIASFSQGDQDFLRDSTDGKTPGAKAGGWSRFRGPDGLGIADATGLPLEWNQTKNLAWKP